MGGIFTFCFFLFLPLFYFFAFYQALFILPPSLHVNLALQVLSILSPYLCICLCALSASFCALSLIPFHLGLFIALPSNSPFFSRGILTTVPGTFILLLPTFLSLLARSVQYWAHDSFLYAKNQIFSFSEVNSFLLWRRTNAIEVWIVQILNIEKI